MFSIVKKKTLQYLHDRVNELPKQLLSLESKLRLLEEENEDHRAKLASLLEDKTKADQENQELKAEIERLNSVHDLHSSVTFYFADDLQQVTPYVRFNPNVTEKLIELRYIEDGKASNHAIQLALMMIANEGLEQILEQFEAKAED